MDSMYDLECVLFNSKSSVKGTVPLWCSIVETWSLKDILMKGNSKSNNKCVGVGVDYNDSEC